jgi:hypothetical protein
MIFALIIAIAAGAIGLIVGAVSLYSMVASHHDAGSKAQAEQLRRYWSAAGKSWPEVEEMLRHAGRRLLAADALACANRQRTEEDVRAILGPPDAVLTGAEMQAADLEHHPDAWGVYVYKVGRFGYDLEQLKAEALLVMFDVGGRVVQASSAAGDNALWADISRDTRTEKRVSEPPEPIAML